MDGTHLDFKMSKIIFVSRTYFISKIAMNTWNKLQS